MSADGTTATNTLPRDVSDRRAEGWWALLGLCVSLAAILASFIVAYFYLAADHGTWPPLGIDRPAPGLAVIGTGFLLATGVSAFLAESRIRRGQRGSAKVALAASFVLGLAAFGFEVVEYGRQPFDLGSHAYASAFLVLVGFHTAQVALALAMTAAVQLWLWLGYYGERRNLAIRNVASYWYYVIASWFVVFLVLYVSPFFTR